MPVDLKIRHERCTGFTPEQRRFEPYRTASPREPMRRRSFSPTRCTSPGGRVRQISRLMASQKLRQVPVALNIRHEHRTGPTPEERRFESYRTASPREPIRRRSFPPTCCTTPGGRVRLFSRQMASQKLRQVPIDLKIRHERRTGSTPEERRFEPYRTASPREPLRRRTGAPNATCENWPSFVRHQSVVTNLEALHLQIISPSGMSHLPLCSARPHGNR